MGIIQVDERELNSLEGKAYGYDCLYMKHKIIVDTLKEYLTMKSTDGKIARQSLREKLKKIIGE